MIVSQADNVVRRNSSSMENKIADTDKLNGQKKIVFKYTIAVFFIAIVWSMIIFLILRSHKKQELQSCEARIVNTVEMVNDFFNTEYFSYVVRIAKMPEMADYFQGKAAEEKVLPVLETATALSDAIFTALIGPDGKIATLSSYEKRDKVLELDVRDRMYVIKGLRGEISLSLNFGRVSGKMAAQFAAPVFRKNSREVLGIVMLDLDAVILDRFFSLIPEPAFLFSPEGIIFATNREDYRGQAVADYSSLLQNDTSVLDSLLETCPFYPADRFVEYKVDRFPGWVILAVPVFHFPIITVFIFTVVYLSILLFGWIVFLLRKRKHDFILANIAVNEARKRELEILEREYAANELVGKLEKSEARLRLAQESAGVGIWSYDIESKKIEWSDFIVSVFDLEENDFRAVLVEYLHSVYLDADDRVKLSPVDFSEKTGNKEYECQVDSLASKLKHWVALKGKCVYSRDNNAVRIIGTLILIDERKSAEFERKRLEEQIQHSQRLDAIGKLAGGIAHDFNNMLCGIIGSADVLATKLKGDPKGLELNSMIISTAERAAELTKQLLAFSRKQSVVMKTVDLNEIIESSVRLLRRTIDLQIEIVQDLTAEKSEISGDAAQLQSVIMNMGINASHAIDGAGEIRIITRNIYLDEIYCKVNNFKVTPGQYIEMEVIDNGCGIGRDIIKKIFEPFFTTKEEGKGTGLGLSAVYGIIQQHHGAVSVYSEVGKGTSFHVLLPLNSAENNSSNKESDRLYMGKGRILVIDDEEVMRKNAQFVLADLGYEIVVAKNGEEGLAAFKQADKPFDLVIIDMVMPVMSGIDCFTEMKKIDPQLKVVLASGFSRDEDVRNMKEAGLCEFIHKPYRSAYLSKVIHNVLRGK